MNHKYDGSFLDGLISVVERVLGTHRPLKSNPDAIMGHPGASRELPTPTEQRDAWVRRNGPDEPEADN